MPTSVAPTDDEPTDPSEPIDPAGSPTPTVDPQETLQRSALYEVGKMPKANCRSNSNGPLDNLVNVTAYYESVLPCPAHVGDCNTWTLDAGKVSSDRADDDCANDVVPRHASPAV